MKSLIIPIFILLITAFGLLGALAGPEEKISEIQQQPSNLYPDYNDRPRTVTQTPTRIIATETEEQLLADPNKIIATIQKFEGLQETLEQIENESKDEENSWLQTRTDNRLTLARSVRKHVAAELILLRKIAKEEGAEKTIAAIDGLLLQRHERFENINKKLEEEKRELRQQQDQRRRSYNPRQRSPRGRMPRGRTNRENP